jgi:hypothetical protein
VFSDLKTEFPFSFWEKGLRDEGKNRFIDFFNFAEYFYYYFIGDQYAD